MDSLYSFFIIVMSYYILLPCLSVCLSGVSLFLLKSEARGSDPEDFVSLSYHNHE